MSRIKIKHFGPIKEGFKEALPDGTINNWLDVKKVTVFIGNQGSGKSTVAKLIATFMWLEKGLLRGDITAPISNDDFIEFLNFHRLGEYFTANTEIEYEGAYYFLKLAGTSTSKIVEASRLNRDDINLPKIRYVPAERSFLSSIENINKVSDLIVGSLKNYSIEFRNAQLALNGNEIELPINNTKIIYDQKTDENYLILKNKKLKLTHASSGFHSLVPLHWVTRYLIDFISQSEKKLLESLSTDQTVRRNNELKELNKLNLDEEELRNREKEINKKYICNHLVNIVEEPELNLFPMSQRKVLNSLLDFNNMIDDNKLIMTTHSPYLINYLTLAVKAFLVATTISNDNAKSKMNKIVPLTSLINPDDLVIYELNEENGEIKILPDYKGLPSDENYLNMGLEESNELFAQLQEIEKGWR